MKKMFLFAAVALATVSLSANPLKGWSPTRSDLVGKNPDMIKIAADSITLNGIANPKKWMYFKASGVNAKKGQPVEFTIKAAGKGVVEIGYYEYRSGFNAVLLNVKKVALTDKAAEQKIVVTVKHGEATLIRPIICLSTGSQIVLNSFSMKVNAAPAAK